MKATSVIAFIRSERHRRGISHKELAKEAGISLNTAWRMEKTGNCEMETFIKVVNCFWDDLAAFGEDFMEWEASHEVL